MGKRGLGSGYAHEGKTPARIWIIDSTLASVGYGMLAILAADLRDCGSNADECQMQLEKVKKQYKYLLHDRRPDLPLPQRQSQPHRHGHSPRIEHLADTQSRP